MRKQKHKFLRRFVAVTYVEAPFGPGLYVHPGLYTKPYGFTGKVRRRRAKDITTFDNRENRNKHISRQVDYSGSMKPEWIQGFIDYVRG